VEVVSRLNRSEADDFVTSDTVGLPILQHVEFNICNLRLWSLAHIAC
jgi:hypothetical protein